MKKQPSRVGMYLVFVVMMIIGYLYLNDQVMTQDDYSLEALTIAAEEGQVLSAKIYQNKQVPTGSVVVELTDDSQRRVYVTDVKVAEELLRENGVHPEIYQQ